MKNIRINISVLFFLCVCFVVSCSDSGKKTEQPVVAATTTTTTTAPDLNHVKADLPKSEGYQTFMANCGICHSPRYIQDQPDLPAKTWAAIVTKMQKTFGAPVSDSSAKIITDYLVAIKGKG